MPGSPPTCPQRCAGRSRRLLPAGRGATAGRALAGAALALLLAGLSWLALALPVVSLLAAAAGLAAPFVRDRRRRARERREADRAWAAALDQLADGLEAGLALAAAASAVAQAGPAALRHRFVLFVEGARRGELDEAIHALAEAPGSSAAPVAALLRAALSRAPGRAASRRSCASSPRSRVTASSAAEQARGRTLALQREATLLAASPLCFLALIGWSSPGYLDAYRSAAGTAVSLAAAAVIAACYLAMLRLGRITTPGGRP